MARQSMMARLGSVSRGRHVSWLLVMVAVMALWAEHSLDVATAQEASDIMLDDDNLEMPDEGEPYEAEPYEAVEGTTVNADEASSTVAEPPIPTEPYVKPSVTGLLFAEIFDEDWATRWVKSTVEKFSGRWERALRAKEVLVGDYGLKVMDRAQHHAISAKVPKIATKDTSFVLSYEAKFEQGLTCGGAYLKVFDSSTIDNLSVFDNETPYVIMFGPDRCGETNKVHLIIKSKSPVTGEWAEHHLVPPVGLPVGLTTTHLYTIRINVDDTYELLLDNISAKKGSMHTDFDPPFTPPKEIDDPEDIKPEDWVDDPKMEDPTATKPGDWDEDAPRKIPDPKATIPEDWLVDESPEISNPDATKPEDWDDEWDGEWTPPTVKNPMCSVGCGPWTAPTVDNPAYKGKWYAPLIDNPAYKGEWEPKKIPNPAYYENTHPHEFSGVTLDAIGFELWTMDDAILFDNIVLSQDWDAVQEFIKQTFAIRNRIETAHQQASLEAAERDAAGKRTLWENVVHRASTFFKANPVAASVAALMSMGSAFYLITRAAAALKLKENKSKSDTHSAASDTGSSDTGSSATDGASSSTGKASKGKRAKSDEKIEMSGDDVQSSKTRKRGGRPVQAD